MKYSFSRIDNFHGCKRNYYYTYIKGERSGDNIYSYLGTCVHELTQAIIRGEETKESAKLKFIEAVEEAEMFDLEWLSESTKTKYVECICHFFDHYSPIKNDTIRIEEEFNIEIEGIKLRGFIDLWYRIDDTIYIVDLKTSSKFSKKDLEKKGRQLILYAIALHERYPEYKIVLQFNMLKYSLNQRGTLVERNTLDIFDEVRDAIVNVEFNEKVMNDTKKFIINTVKEINKLDTTSIEDWEMGYDPEKDFFCKHLCGHRGKCLEIE